LKIKLLPSNVNADGQLQLLTTFLINDRVTIDAGSIAVALTPEEMAKIRHVFITHTHNDHIASLSIFIAEAYTMLDTPVTVYGIRQVIRALEDLVFNDIIFPDFEKIQLPNRQGSTIQYRTLTARETITVDGLRVTPIPVHHTVPTCGMMVADDAATVVFSGDTYKTDELWERASNEENLKAIFVDVSYPNELEWLAQTSGHFTPQALAADLQKLTRAAQIFPYHIKATNREQVIEQLHALNDPRIIITEIGRLYEF